MKIFGTGLQRTGTMSLTQALDRINFRANQFPKELYQDVHHPIINEYDAFTDFPIPLIYKALDKAYPGSKFIHTIRDEQKWLNSVRWLFTIGRIKFNTVDNHYAQTFHQAFYGTMHFDETLFLSRYREHNEEVAAYFADRPDDLLVINLADGNNYEKICCFLDAPVPDEPFPFKNKSEAAGKIRFRKFRRRTLKKLKRISRRSRLGPIFLMGKGLLSPHRLTSQPERLSCVPVFILTTGRSGSTLLRAILNQHPTICIPPESHRLGTIIKEFKQNFRYLPWPDVVSLVTAEFQKERGFAFWNLDLAGFFKQAQNLALEDRNLARLIDLFYNYYIQTHKPEAMRWGDKSIKNAPQLQQLNELFPNAKYLHIYRDGRDVALSLFNEGLYPNPTSAAEHWLNFITKIKEFGNNLPNGRFFEVAYEQLVQQPDQTVQKVCDFLALDYRPEMLDFWQNVDRLGDTSREFHQNLKNPINTNAIGKWEQEFNETQQALVDDHLAAMLAQLGYK